MEMKRWEKIVEATEFYSDGLRVCRSADVLKLLARQHAAFVRLVKRFKKQYEQDGSDVDLVLACEDILDALAKQGKGGR